jgi:hypothetical protein
LVRRRAEAASPTDAKPSERRLSRDKPDTGPFVSPADLSDEELRPYVNEASRRKMKLRRAKQKEQT